MRDTTAWAIAYFLMSQLWLIGSWFIQDVVSSLMMLGISFVFMLAFVFGMWMDRKSTELDFLSRKARRDLEFAYWDGVIKLLSNISKEAGKDWKQFIKGAKKKSANKKRTKS